MKKKVMIYLFFNCGQGKQYSHPSVLLSKLRKTRRLRWAGIPVKEFIVILEEVLSTGEFENQKSNIEMEESK